MGELAAGDLRALASLVRCGLPPRAALAELGSSREGLGRLEARLVLGADPASALRGCASGSGVTSMFALHEAHGGDLAAMLDGAAEELESSATKVRSAESASSGAILSMKLIAALPFLWLPLGAAQGELSIGGDGPFVAAGLALGAIGWRWMTRLVPRPAGRDVAGHIAAGTSHLLAAGMSLDDAIDWSLAACRQEDWIDGVRARRQLGCRWSYALRGRAPDYLRAFIDAIERIERSGESSARALMELSRFHAAESERAFEYRLKRAPVLMVLPLGLCVLPSFLLVAVVPAIRGFSG